MDCYIICDGSFDKTSKIGAMAGSVSINNNLSEVKVDYLTELFDSTDAEMHAINLMLDQISPEDFVKISSLRIFTDSQQSIDIISGNRYYKPGTHRELLVDTIRSKIEGTNVIFNKIKAHVDKDVARNLHVVHNEVDKLASNAMKNVRDPLMYPNSFKKDTRSILLHVDRDNINQNFDDVIDLISSLSAKSYSVSVSAEDNEAIDKIQKALSTVECKGTIYLNEITHNIKVTDTDPTYIAGLERALLRVFLEGRKINYDGFINRASDTTINSLEAASQSILCRNVDFQQGHPHCLISMTGKSGCETVNDVGYWINSLSSHLGIPKLTNNKIIFRKLGVESKLKEKKKHYEPTYP